MSVVKIIVALLFTFLHLKSVHLESCRTQENTEGDCIPFNDCFVLKNLIPMARKDSSIREYLQRSQCKVTHQPHVCCPRVELPRAADGACGRQFEALDNLPTRIVGGENAHLGEFPWAALLIYQKPGKNIGYNCGATIITSRHVLTAAHCSSTETIPASWNLTGVRVGELDRETASDCEEINSVYYCGFPPLDFDIEMVYVHEQYLSYQSGNPYDIAVIKLRKTIEFNEFVRPICLPLNREINTAYGTPTVAGFGRTEESENSKRLKKAEVDIVNNSVCASQYKQHGRTIDKSHICASRSNADACSGDSGGGLIKQADNSPVWYLIGVVSFGPRKCARDYPGVYVNVKDYIQWIRNKVAGRN